MPPRGGISCSLRPFLRSDKKTCSASSTHPKRITVIPRWGGNHFKSFVCDHFSHQTSNTHIKNHRVAIQQIRESKKQSPDPTCFEADTSFLLCDKSMRQEHSRSFILEKVEFSLRRFGNRDACWDNSAQSFVLRAVAAIIGRAGLGRVSRIQ